MEPPLREVDVNLTAAYLNTRVSGASDIQLIKNMKYLIILPPMWEYVFEEGGLLGHTQNLKYQYYNLKDPEKFPQFQTD